MEESGHQSRTQNKPQESTGINPGEERQTLPLPRPLLNEPFKNSVGNLKVEPFATQTFSSV